MYLSRDLNLFLLLWKKLKPEAKFEVVRTIAITFIFNLFELLNIFLASSFAYVITGNNLNNSEKLGFITKILSLNELDLLGNLK